MFKVKGILLAAALAGFSFGAQTVKFGVIADPQYGWEHWTGPGLNIRVSDEKIGQVLRSMPADLSFVTIVGDLVEAQTGAGDKGNINSTVTSSEVTAVNNFNVMMDTIKSSQYGIVGKNMYPVVGNHEYCTTGGAAFKDPVREMGIYPNPYIQDERANGYYTFEKQGFLFITLNTSELPYGDGDRNGMSTAQYNWLDTKLQEAQLKGQEVIILSHQPIGSYNHSSGTYPGYYYDCTKLYSITDRYDCIIASLAGHVHNKYDTALSGSYDSFRQFTFRAMHQNTTRPPYYVLLVNRENNTITVDDYSTAPNKTRRTYTYNTPTPVGFYENINAVIND